MENTYAELKKAKAKNGEAAFEAQIPLEATDAAADEILAHKAQSFRLPGFRTGKVPLNILRQYVSEMELFEDAADRALRDAVREIAAAEKIEAIGIPQIEVTEIKPGSPVAFKVRFALFPEIDLPNYKKIGQAIMERKDDAAITDAELEKAIAGLREMLAAQHGDKVEDAAAELPELTDETVTQFGPFKSVADFKAEFRNQLAHEKEMAAKDAKRGEIIADIMKRTKIEIPPLLMEQEWQRFLEERDAELLKAGMPLEEYLKQIKKTEKEFEKDERERIENQLKTSLVFKKIQDAENITASEQEIKANTSYLKARYPGRDAASVRRAAEAFIMQEKIFALFKKEEPPAPLSEK